MWEMPIHTFPSITLNNWEQSGVNCTTLLQYVLKKNQEISQLFYLLWKHQSISHLNRYEYEAKHFIKVCLILNYVTVNVIILSGEREISIQIWHFYVFASGILDYNACGSSSNNDNNTKII